MNWGMKLMIGMGTFMTFIMVMAIIMFNSRTDALVDIDYYEKGLNYDSDYHKKELVKADKASPHISGVSAGLMLKFRAPATGTVKLIRNADKKMDRVMPIRTDQENKVILPLSGIAKGRWKLIITWNDNNKTYLDEQEVDLK